MRNLGRELRSVFKMMPRLFFGAVAGGECVPLCGDYKFNESLRVNVMSAAISREYGKARNAAHRCGLLRLLPYGLPRNDAITATPTLLVGK